MTCVEGERLKSEVLNRIEQYLEAEEEQRRSLERYGDASPLMAEHAYEALSETRRRYWAHVKQHNCDESFDLAQPAGMPQPVAV